MWKSRYKLHHITQFRSRGFQVHFYTYTYTQPNSLILVEFEKFARCKFLVCLNCCQSLFFVDEETLIFIKYQDEVENDLLNWSWFKKVLKMLSTQCFYLLEIVSSKSSMTRLKWSWRRLIWNFEKKVNELIVEGYSHSNKSYTCWNQTIGLKLVLR